MSSSGVLLKKSHEMLNKKIDRETAIFHTGVERRKYLRLDI